MAQLGYIFFSSCKVKLLCEQIVLIPMSAGVLVKLFPGECKGIGTF